MKPTLDVDPFILSLNPTWDQVFDFIHKCVTFQLDMLDYLHTEASKLDLEVPFSKLKISEARKEYAALHERLLKSEGSSKVTDLVLKKVVENAALSIALLDSLAESFQGQTGPKAEHFRAHIAQVRAAMQSTIPTIAPAVH